jgi:outer membrane protein OmpA-like peptidoglycan-associated protein
MMKIKRKIHLIFCVILSFSQWVFSQENSSNEDFLLNVLGEESIYFENDSYFFDTNQYTSLLAKLDSLASEKELTFTLEGRTNDIGTLEYNELLAQNRINTISTVIKSRFPSSEISKAIYGERQPIYNNATEEGLIKNRCVLVKIFKKQAARIIRGVVLKANGKPQPQAMVIFYNKFFQDTTYTDEKGVYTAKVLDKQPVDIQARIKNHLSASQTVFVDATSATKPHRITVTEITPGQKLTFENIHFSGNKNIILPQSLAPLKHLLNQAKQNPDFCFEIMGHVNATSYNPKQDGWYQGLSEARAGKVYQYLINNGINKERMIPVGYSYSQMIHPFSKNLKEQEVNRRIEIKIMECDSVKINRTKLDEKKLFSTVLNPSYAKE